MSLTLGEKLRQAREERGISISEVAEQTRISPHYLESIENDDYRPLPGGIFNKGFVKSYAKYVELDEQEALQDYSRAISASEGRDEHDLKVYKPEVLTDDRSGSSMIPTVIWAAVILGLMSAGIYFGLNYIRNWPETPVEDKPVASANTGAQSGNTNAKTATTPVGAAPDMSALKVEFKALREPVSLSATSDGKNSVNVVTPGSTSTFEPKESLKLSYSRSLAALVQLTINGKDIVLPAQPLVPRRNTIEFEINKDNLGQIWQNGAISTDVPGAVADTTVGAPTSGTPPPAFPRPTIVRPAANASAANSTGPKPGETPKAAPPPKSDPPKPGVANKP